MSGFILNDFTKGSGLIIEHLQGGATIAAYSVVYLDSNGQWQAADADAVATMPTVGLSTEQLRLNQKGRVVLIGTASLSSWTWTPGAEIYASTTAGALTQTAPTGAGDVVQVVAMAITATEIYFNPSGFGSSGNQSNTLEGETAFVGTDATKSGFVNYFLVDGTADEVQINQAITYVGSLGGGSVMLERGTYTLATTVAMNQAEVILAGQGWNTYLNGATFGHAVTVTGARCQVKDLRASTTGGATNAYDGINITGADCIVERIWVSDSDRHGIFVNGSGGKIQHNLIESVDDNGVSIGSTGDNSIVSDNEIDTTGGDGVLIDAAGENCHVSDNRIVSWTGEPVDDNSGTSTVEDNWAGGTVLTSKGCSMATIALALTYVGAEGWVEVPSGTWDEAVTISNADVILRGQGWDTIINETADSNHAITVGSGGDRVMIRDLQCQTTPGGTNNFDGINVAGDDVLIDHVYVSASDRHGITLSATRAKVVHCRIDTLDDSGILANASNCIIEGNTISNAGSFGVGVGASGDNCVIDGNSIITTGDDGINIDTNGENCIVDSNRITNWTNECIDDDSGTSTLGDNECT